LTEYDHLVFFHNPLEVVVTHKKEDGTRVEIEVTPKAIHLTYGYSRDHRIDPKQFVMNLIFGGAECGL
jgi:transposase